MPENSLIRSLPSPVSLLHIISTAKKVGSTSFHTPFCDISENVMNSYPADSDLSQVNKGNIRKRYEKLHVKIKNNDTIFIAKFEWILHTVLMFPLLTLDK